jgi:hypothetical protein
VGHEVRPHQWDQPAPCASDVGVGEAIRRRLGHPDGLGLLDDHVLKLHGVPPFECSEMRLDSPQAFLLLTDGVLDLRAPQPQHALQLLEAQALAQDLTDLLEAEAHVT